MYRDRQGEGANAWDFVTLAPHSIVSVSLSMDSLVGLNEYNHLYAMAIQI